MSAALVLPSELTICTVGELRPQWLAWLAANPAGVALVDAAAVGEVDAAGVQLLLALQAALQLRERELRLVAASAALAGACTALGLQALLPAADPAGACA